MVPTIKDPLDTANFDDWSHQHDKAQKAFPPLNETDAQIFCNF
jgi:hypothetical protein